VSLTDLAEGVWDMTVVESLFVSDLDSGSASVGRGTSSVELRRLFLLEVR